MKQLSAIFLILLLISCSEKRNNENDSNVNLLADITYTVDTVIAKSGEELLVLGDETIGIWSLSTDLKRMLIFSKKGNSIQEIDLDKLELIAQYPFEKEGPNGTGNRVMGIQELDNKNFVFSTYFATYVFDRTGNMIKDYKLNSNEIDGIDFEDDFLLNNNAKIFGDGKKLYANRYTSSEAQLIMVDLNEMKADTFSLAKLSKTSTFSTMYLKSGTMRFFNLSIQMQYLRNRIFIHSPVINTCYVYDPITNLIQEKNFSHKLIPLEKVRGDFPSEASSLQEFNSTMSEINGQIHFGRFFWDESRQLYFRLSQMGIENELADRKKKYRTFIHTFDENLNLVGESYLKEFQSKLNAHFFKDGKLWSYVNLDDELGFAVFTFSL